VVLVVSGSDPDLPDRGDLGDQPGLVPAKEDLKQDEDEEATAGT
jgi:hypothetical protein